MEISAIVLELLHNVHITQWSQFTPQHSLW